MGDLTQWMWKRTITIHFNCEPINDVLKTEYLETSVCNRVCRVIRIVITNEILSYRTEGVLLYFGQRTYTKLKYMVSEYVYSIWNNLTYIWVQTNTIMFWMIMQIIESYNDLFFLENVVNRIVYTFSEGKHDRQPFLSG